MTEVKFQYDPKGYADYSSQFNSIVTKEDLALNLACYNEDDDLYIEDQIEEKYISSGKIKPKKLRFFKSFINSKANIYNNFFIRIVNGDTSLIDCEELNCMLEQCEKYAHISGQSILYLKSIDEFIPLDPSRYDKISDKHYIIQTDDGCLIVRDTGVYTEGVDDEGKRFEICIKPTTVLPIVEFKLTNKPIRNGMVSLQYEFIADISWGIYNSAPKLLTQVIVASDAPDDEIKAHTSNIGRTTKTVKTAMNDKIYTIDMGDLKNLQDIVTVYNNCIKQMAVSQGVNKNTVDITGFFESGIAKIIEMNYINENRKQYFRMFKKSEKTLWFALSKLFNLSLEYVNIKFFPLKFTSEPMNEYIESLTISQTEYDTFVQSMKTNVEASNDVNSTITTPTEKNNDDLIEEKMETINTEIDTALSNQ